MKGFVAAVAACTALKAAAFCPRPPERICSSYFQAEKVFVGRVEDKVPIFPAPNPAEFDSYAIPDGFVLHLQVLERIKGEVGSREWFYEDNDSGRSWLGPGDTRVIFMTDHSVGGCGPQYRDEQTPHILQRIQELASSPSSVRLHVEPHFSGDRTGKDRPFLPRSVEIWGTDGVTRTVTPDAAGGYPEVELPPGAYRFTTQGINGGVSEFIHNVFVLRPGECSQHDLEYWSPPWRQRPGDAFFVTDMMKWLLQPQ